MTAVPPTPWPTATRAWLTVGVLLLAYTLAYVDRAILTILVEPIQRDLHINDTEVGLLHGFAFVIFYVGLGIPLGFFADRTRRMGLVTVSVVIWSLMTAACGLTRTFGQLFAARIGVGIGEAGLTPAAYSLIGDLFPPARRTSALGVYTLGIYLGGGLAILAGGLVVAMVGSRPTVMVPLLGPIRAWQSVFLIVGLPGLAVSLLVAAVPEPARRLLRGEAGAARPGADVGALVRRLRSQGSAYALLILGFAFLGTPFNVALLWARPYLSRRFGVSPAEGAYIVGFAMLVFATAGIVCGSLLSDRLTARGNPAGPVRTGMISGLMMLVPAALFPLAPSLPLAALDLAALLFTGAFAIGSAAAALQVITPNRMRATVSALYLLVVNLIGLTAGPVVTGALTDYVFRDKTAVGWSAAIVSVVCALAAIAAFAAVGRPFRSAAEALASETRALDDATPSPA